MEYEDCMMDDEDEELEDCEDTEPVNKKKKRKIEVEEVVGMGSAETVIEVCIPLCPPAFEVLENLIDKQIIFDALIASKGRVFVNGRVIKDIPYKTRVKTCEPGCENISKLTFGNIKHVTAEIPFALCIDVPEACKGNKVVVLETEVNSVEMPNFTNCLPNRCVAACTPHKVKFDTCHKKLFKSITEKDCIFVKVKVVKDVIIDVPCYK